MTHPPHNGTNHSHSGDDGDNEDKTYYPPSNHPEDRADFGYAGAEQAAYGSYAGNTDNGGNAAATHSAGASGAQVGETGKIDVLQAVSWGLSTTFKNAKLWLLIGLVIFLSVIGAGIANVVFAVNNTNFENLDANSMDAAAESGGVFGTVLTMVIVLVSFVVTPYLYRLALFQVDDPHTGWGHLWKDTPLIRAIGVMLCTGIVSAILYTVTLLPVSRSFGDAVTEETSLGATEGMLTAVGLVVMVLWSIVSMFMAWAAVSGQYGFGESFRVGWKIGWRNFGKLLLFVIIANIAMTILIVVTLTLGIIVIMPAYFLVMAHMFRQAVGPTAN